MTTNPAGPVNTGPACAVCGAPCRPAFRAPTAELAPDLDHRPGEPARSTLSRWIATCRRCGASGPDLAALPAGADAVIRSDPYQGLSGPAPAMPFLRWAAICEGVGDLPAAAEAILQAAWALDDAGEDTVEDAAGLRRRSVQLFEAAHTDDGLRLIDLLRRAGDFAAAKRWSDRLDGRSLDENSAAILVFQNARIAAGDTGRHMISSALRPPARRPHVTHGREQAAGFWSRLFAR